MAEFAQTAINKINQFYLNNFNIMTNVYTTLVIFVLEK